MSGYALHPEAYTDLDEIRSYTTDHSLDAADRVVTEIFDAIRALVPLPNQGHKRPDLTSRPLRFTHPRPTQSAHYSGHLTRESVADRVFPRCCAGDPLLSGR